MIAKISPLKFCALACIGVALLSLQSQHAAADFGAGQIAAHNGDHETAMAEWLPLARAGDAKSQYAVGALFVEGLGTPQDLGEAVRWWRQAAEQAHAGARYNIAVMYKEGLGVGKDTGEAMKWLNLAAAQGNTDAHVQLSRYHGSGCGVDRDPVLAYMWLEIAQLSGRTSVARSLETQGAELSNAQVDDAKERAQIWMRENELQ